MKTKPMLLVTVLSLFTLRCTTVKPITQPVNEGDYLSIIKTELNKQWPKNRTINLVFHGHSVPSGYAKTPEVHTFDSYPYQLLALLKQRYPYAVINIIVTAKGGENSLQGAKRFERDVLIHKPDVLFIDYALNELNVDSTKTYLAWNSMIKKAKSQGIKIILLTPSPDLRVNMTSPVNSLSQHAKQIIRLARENQVGVVNSLGIFNALYAKGDSLKNYMAQVNHPNKSGNALIANELLKWFK